MVCFIGMLKRDSNDFSIEDFGFEHRLWIYSGRRGVHCWVCDQTARESQSTIRQAIVEHLTVLAVGRKVHLGLFSFISFPLGWKRFDKTCDTLSSITSIITVMRKKLHIDNLHRMRKYFRKAREILLSEFDRYACLDQDFLADDQRIERFLRLVPDDNILFFLLLVFLNRFSFFEMEIFLNAKNLYVDRHCGKSSLN